MILFYMALFVVDAVIPLFLKSCSLYWAIGVVILLMMMFSDRIPTPLKAFVSMTLAGIAIASAVQIAASKYLTVAYPLLIVQSALMIPLVLTTKTSPRHKKPRRFS